MITQHYPRSGSAAPDTRYRHVRNQSSRSSGNFEFGRRKVTLYLDLKQGDTLLFDSDGLEARVLSLQRNILVLDISGEVKTLRENSTTRLGSTYLSISGRRHVAHGSHRGGYQGKRVHATLILPTKDYKFSHVKNRISEGNSYTVTGQ